MILIGQYDSPFVRRVGVALTLHGIAFEQRPWSVWADAEALAMLNPLRRVPTLVLEDGETLIESSAILDALDEMAGPERALLPRSGAARRRALRICALGSGLADKAVSLLYEGVLHAAPSPVWIERCEAQIADVLTVLEADRGAAPGGWWVGPELGHADVMVACALTFLREAHPRLFDPIRWPRLAAHSARCERLPAFQAIRQPLSVAVKAGD
ncbi:MAG TPA: glutathione S-transferase family protein [Caulobacteraceae bacterium]|nr:glutathione S-transferase family protein [Caulobacteraceae bacterium]